jgi:hypothetical protein
VSREQKVFLKSVQWLSMLLLPDLVPLLTIWSRAYEEFLISDGDSIVRAMIL